MFDFTSLGKLGVLLILAICGFTGCGVATASKPITTDANTTGAELVRGTAIGQVAPDFSLEKVEGERISTSDIAGKPAVLVFWTAWCPSCKEEAPHINKLNEEFKNKGVKVVGINIGESDARINEGIKDFPIKYEVAKDKDSSVSKAFKVIGTPTVVFLDAKGKVQYFGNELPKNYAERLNELIGS